MQKVMVPQDKDLQGYDRENDQHVFAIDRLVQELGLPAEVVNRHYREVLDKLKQYCVANCVLHAVASIGVLARLAPGDPKSRTVMEM